MKMMRAQLDFFHGNIYNLVFPDKKKPNSKNFVHMGFCGHKVSTKFQDFAAATIKWGDLDLFLVYFMISYLTTYNHSTT